MIDESASRQGAQALDEVEAFLRRFVVFPADHAFVAVALWVAHTWAAERFYVTPRLILDSAEPGSGKTRVLELLGLLCRMPKLTISTTTAALYRRIAAAEVPLTVLMDEVDAVFGPRPTPQAEDLRALLNAGYKRGATVDRCVGEGKSLKVAEFPVFAPVALAGLAGRMPATLTTRAVVIHMRRRAPGETVTPFRERDAEASAAPIRTQLLRWIDSVAERLEDARPAMPEKVVDRPAEVWEALLAVADEAGGNWPERVREACRYFVLGTDPGELSFGIRLLADIRRVFWPEPTEEEPAPTQHDRMRSAALVEALVKLDESPYADLWGKPLDQRRLAKELKRYGVEPGVIKLQDGSSPRGYKTDGPTGLADTWRRYLPDSCATGATTATAQATTVADGTKVADVSATGPVNATRRGGLTSGVAQVADVALEDEPLWRTP